MRSTVIIFVALFVLTSCNTRQVKLPAQIHFTTRKLQLKADTTITAIAYFKDNIICLQDNDKMIVLDTNYNRQMSLEDNFAGYKPTSLFTVHDTVLLATKSKTFFIDSNFKLQEFKRKERIYGSNLFEDSSFYVYGCCAGEFGGSIFFLNKKTNNLLVLCNLRDTSSQIQEPVCGVQ